jgi:hypothetical protein
MNKRHQSRKQIAHATVMISDGEEVFQGTLSNASYAGLLVDGIPAEIGLRRKALEVTVSSQGRVFDLRAIPIWSSVSNNAMTIGLRLFSVPRRWYAFVDGVSFGPVDGPTFPLPKTHAEQQL